MKLTLNPNSNPSEYIASYVSRPLLALGLNLTLQSGIKYILTQGDAILITSLTTLHDQGTYALASNYGGLIARMLFQPIEEASRNLFAKLCAPNSTKSPTPDTSNAPNQPSPNLTQAATTLHTILHFYTLLSLTILAFGSPLAPLLLTLLAGSKWSSTGAGTVLATYCYYIPLLALNGVTEAFVAAVASPSELRTQSLLMGINFVAFAGAAYLFLGVWEMGAAGLVWANCVNMGSRLVYNVVFIGRFFGGRGVRFGWRGCVPTVGSVAVAVAAAGVVRMEGVVTEGLMGALVKGAAVAVVYAGFVGVFERRFFVHCWRLMRPGSEPAAMKKSQ